MDRITKSTDDADGTPPRENRIVAALRLPERLRLLEMTTSVNLNARSVLFEPGSGLDAVYFPTDGVVSLVTPVHMGTSVEVATIGNEGVVGVPLVQPLTGLAVRAVTQVGGHGLRLEASVFADWVAQSPSFQTLVDRYTKALFGQIAQVAACNRVHSIEERLSRRLLMTQDRVESNQLEITQEVLAQMLGSRRSTVSVSVGVLQRAGLITHTAGHVTIVDREGLEAVSCECYAVIKAQLDSVSGEPPRPPA